MEIYRVTKDSPRWQKIGYNAIRTDAFCFGQNIPVECEFEGDDLDGDLNIVLIVKNHKPVAGLRITYPLEGVGKIERVCTVREEQRSGLGRIMIAEAEKWIAERGIRHIVIDSQDRAAGFYHKCGYATNLEVDPDIYHPNKKKRHQGPPPGLEDVPPLGFTCVLVEKYLDDPEE
ncbi:MAG: GNAT family N-acetyltransferase [Oscillospiraceae bacterium]|nr:GNAT family N-acetyltransferase [Oscillospiraceae bacterium]